MQRGIKPSHQPISQNGTQPDPERVPAPTMNALMGKLGLAKESDEPAADEAELARSLTDPAWTVRVATVQKLGSMGKQAPLELLLVALRDEQSSVRIAATRALSRSPRQAALPALIAALTDSAWVVRTEAVRALGKLPALESLEALLTATHDSDAAVRSAAITALGETGAEDAIEQFNAALQDEDWSVREAATLALRQLATQETIPPLLNARLDPDASVRAAAEAGLQQIYPAIAPAPPPPSDSFAQWLERIKLPPEEALAHEKEHPTSDAPNPRQPETQAVRTRALPDKSRTPAKQDTRPGWSHKAILLAEGLVALLLLAGLVFAWVTIANRPAIAPVAQSNPSAFTIYRGHNTSVEKLAWSPDGLAIASADSRGMVRIWQVNSGRTSMNYTQQGKVLALSWNDANTLLVAYGVPNQTLQVQELNVGAPSRVQTIFQQLNLPGTPENAAWSPANSTLAFDAGNGTIQLWRVNETAHQYLLTIPARQAQSSPLTWSPDGSQLATISSQGLMQTWNASTGENITALASGQPITSAAWITCDQAGRGLIFAAGQGAIMEWCPQQGKGKATLVFSAQTYNLKNSNHLSVGMLAFAPKANQILLATSDGLVQARDAVSKNLIDVYAGHSAQVNAIAWSPDGHSIATGSADTTVQVWQEP